MVAAAEGVAPRALRELQAVVCRPGSCTCARCTLHVSSEQKLMMDCVVIVQGLPVLLRSMHYVRARAWQDTESECTACPGCKYSVHSAGNCFAILTKTDKTSHLHLVEARTAVGDLRMFVTAPSAERTRAMAPLTPACAALRFSAACRRASSSSILCCEIRTLNASLYPSNRDLCAS